MGILNITPDSFYGGSRFSDSKSVLKRTEAMLAEGATFIDIGAYSSRPGAAHVSEVEELGRIVPIIELLIKEFPLIQISIDTFRSKVAAECIQNGASLINDISAGLLDEQMLSTVAKLKVPYIMMHMKGDPKNMQSKTEYQNLINDIRKYFSERLRLAKDLGIVDIVIDPGFGFAKTLEQNYELLSNLELFRNIEHPLLVGVSRKSMIYKLLDKQPEEALNGTTALNMAALLKGANILRVHDVKEAVECVKLAEQLKSEFIS